MRIEAPDRRLARLRDALVTRSRLCRERTSDRAIATAVASGRLVRINRGCYVEAETWNALYAEDRQVLGALAAASTAVSAPTFSFHTAAALHGLPLYRHDALRVHTTAPHDAPRRAHSRHVHRHQERLTPDDVVEIAGVRFTSLARTVADLARLADEPLALAAADAALRALVRPTRTAASMPASEHVSAMRAALLAPLEAWPGQRGVAAARRLLALASPHAETPLESASRLALLRLGFTVDEQVRVPGPGRHGSGPRDYWVDFRAVNPVDPSAAFLGEADGRVKYVAGSDGNTEFGHDPERTIYAEKRRHDWIEATTSMRLIRWGDRDLATLDTFARMLKAFHVRLPPAPR